MKGFGLILVFTFVSFSPSLADYAYVDNCLAGLTNKTNWSKDPDFQQLVGVATQRWFSVETALGGRAGARHALGVLAERAVRNRNLSNLRRIPPVALGEHRNERGWTLLMIAVSINASPAMIRYLFDNTTVGYAEYLSIVEHLRRQGRRDVLAYIEEGYIHPVEVGAWELVPVDLRSE